MLPAHEPSADSVPIDQRPTAGVGSLTFIGLLITHFLGATNDHALRWLVTGIGKQYFGQERETLVLSIGAASFILPYVLLAAPAGYLADRFSKRQVIFWCKVAEIVVMAVAVISIQIGNAWLLLAILALLGSQAALFGPAKLGSIPEMLDAKSISLANGLLGMVTVAAIVVGTVIGNWLSSESVTGPFGQQAPVLISGILIGLATLGTATTMLIQPLTARNASLRFPYDFFSQTFADLKTLYANRPLFLAVIGSMFFWSLGALFHINIDQFVIEGRATEQMQVTPGLVATVLGVALGSVLAGIWSKGHVELGIVPLGALGLITFSFLLFLIDDPLVAVEGGVATYTSSYKLAWLFFAMLGVSSGLFEVPLAAYIQHHSKPAERGAVLAANNFLVFSGSFAITLLYMALRTTIFSDNPAHKEPLVSARGIFLLCSLVTFPVLIYIVRLLPQATIKFVAWLVAHTTYRINLHQLKHLPSTDGALLVANHVSWIDGLLLFCSSSRPIRLMLADGLLTTWWQRAFARASGAIIVPGVGANARGGLVRARQCIENGDLVCLFAEGRVTRSGQLQSFTRGLLTIVAGTKAPVIPVYLDELWGSIFSYRGGRLFGYWSGKWPHRVSIWFGEPIHNPTSVQQVRQAVQQLSAQATEYRHQRGTNLARMFVRNCRRSMLRWRLSDSTGQTVTGSQLLLRSLILRRLLLREVLGESQEELHVGLLLPPSTGAAITNAAVSLSGRVAVNLNYSVTEPVMNACIRQAGIRHILTTRRVVEKLGMQYDATLVYLEDLKDKITWLDRLAVGLATFVCPSWILERWLGLTKIRSSDPLTVIFTSGSTGEPKGVVLSYGNIASNVDAIDQVVQLRRQDTLLGILPFFHSFGYTVTLWTPLALDVHAAYHFSPLDAKQVGKLAQTYKASILLTTPTFLRSFLKRCTPEEFASLDTVVAGAEKLPTALCDAFEEKFGVRPVEGYGTTELSPLVSVNVPPSRSQRAEVDRKEGSVGRPVPGVATRVVHPDTGEELPHGTAGMLLVSGPNVMQGYLGQPDKTANVIRDGWYVTGDIARVDEDGFIWITGRESRFSKIGGEMVPHLRVEEAIEKVLGITDTDDTGALVVVTAVPDERKGERLVVVHRPLSLTPEDICVRLKAEGLPNLWIPGADSFLETDQIPVLGSGKLDIKAVAQLARKRLGSEVD